MSKKEYHKNIRVSIKEEITDKEILTMFLKVKSLKLWKIKDIFYHNHLMYRVTRLVDYISKNNYIVYIELFK